MEATAELDCWCGVSLQFAPGLAQCLFDRMQLGGCCSESSHIAGAGEGAPPTISAGGSSGEAARSPGGSVSIAGAAQGNSTVEGLHREDRGPGGGCTSGHASGQRVLGRMPAGRSGKEKKQKRRSCERLHCVGTAAFPSGGGRGGGAFAGAGPTRPSGTLSSGARSSQQQTEQ